MGRAYSNRKIARCGARKDQKMELRYISRWNFDTSQLSVRSVVESGGAPRNILSSFLMMLKRLVNTVFVLFAGVERRM